MKKPLRRPCLAIGSKERAELERRLREEADPEAYVKKDRARAKAAAIEPGSIYPGWHEDVMQASGQKCE